MDDLEHVVPSAAADVVPGCPRFDAAVFYAALDARRRALGLRWRDVAVQASVSRSMLSRLGVQHLCPDVHGLARLLVWLGNTDLQPYISTTATVRRRSDVVRDSDM